jgi:subtilisin
MTRMLLLVLLSHSLLLGAAATPAYARQRSLVPSSYIVVLKDSAGDPAPATAKLERKNGFQAKLRYRHALKGFAAKLSARQARALEADPAVAFVAADRRVEATFVPLAPGEPTPPTGIRRIEAATKTGALEASNVNVAVIDTGVQLNHSDLNVVNGTDCVRPGTPADDENGHGTHVAGTIAARNNGAGVVGVVPGTKILAVRVLNRSGVGTSSQVICGFDWVTSTRTDSNPSNDIAVANLSFGGIGQPVEPCATTTDPEHRAICNSTAAGVTYVVAAGNDGWDFDFADAPDTPAAYPEVLTVTAMADSDGRSGGAGGPPGCDPGEVDDRYASFSNFAATSGGAAHTIAGPGSCITSTWVGGGYAIESGTSMATPHVSGVAAFCLASGGPCSGMTPSQVVQKLRVDGQQRVTAVPGYGFQGDPTRPVAGSYFGYLTWTAAGTQDYERPVGASPLRVSLVPAFKGCEAADVNSTHGEPLDFGACHPPRRGSNTARLGPGSIGFASITVCNLGPTDAACNQAGLVKPDLRLVANLRDVRCIGNVPAGCTAEADYNPNGAAGPYTTVCTTAASCGSTGRAGPYCAESGTSASACIAGTDLTEVGVIPGATVGGTGTAFQGRGIRITDTYNEPGGDRAGTVVDLGFPIPIDCLATASTSLGSSCGVNTSANALAPGVVRPGHKAVWQLGEIQVLDSGPDGTRGNADDERVAVQGIFLP